MDDNLLDIPIKLKENDSMSELLSIEYQNLFPPSEVIDKFSILLLKLNRTKLTEEEKNILIECISSGLVLISTLIFKKIENNGEEMPKLVSRFFCYLQELIETNSIQWELEQQVREDSSKENFAMVRKQNKLRTEIKSKIDSIFDLELQAKISKKIEDTKEELG